MSSPVRVHDPRGRAARSVLLSAVVGLALLAGGVPARAALPEALRKPVPENPRDLLAIQRQVQRVLDKVLPCTVGVRMGGGQGSGVIVSADGYVLTAGHVAGQTGRNVTLVLPDGRTVKGKTLGINRSIDSGLIKITEPGKWPHAEMGESARLRPGQWCLAVGHPGGYRPGRSPVVRLGRVLGHSDMLIRTDCTLVGGDSGGPLFDLEGRVIGIHSRIAERITDNIHVPVNTYRETWDRLVAAETWGGRLGQRTVSTPYLGVEVDPDAEDCKIARVMPDSPAAKAGLKVNDVVTRFATRKIATFEELALQVRRQKPGAKVSVEVMRDDKPMTIEVVVGKREE